MKKYIVIFLIVFVLLGVTGCSKATHITNEYKGNVTELSKNYLSEGYIVNLYRSMEPFGNDESSYGKAYVTMSFQVISEYTSTYDYDTLESNKIKKVTVTNVRVLNTSKMGDIEDMAILKLYSQSLSDPKVDVKTTQSKYEYEYSTPTTSGIQSVIWVNLNKIALYDETKSPAALSGAQPTMAQVYSELGIDRDEVAIKIGYRVELLTVGGKILYKDYEITMPPKGIDITSDEYSYQFIEPDVTKMEPFIEKE